MSDRSHTPRGERPARGRGSSRSSARPSRPPHTARGARPARTPARSTATADFNANSNRVFLPILVFAAIAALFVLRLAYLQVIAAPAMASEAENARMSYDWIEPRRGTIYRNLFFIYNAAPFDPDLVLSTGNDNQGIDVYGMPTVRSIGFNIKLEF